MENNFILINNIRRILQIQKKKRSRMVRNLSIKTCPNPISSIIHTYTHAYTYAHTQHIKN